MSQLSGDQASVVPEAAAPRRGLWSPLRRLLARYVQFLAHRRSLGCLTLLIPLAVVLYVIVGNIGPLMPATGETMSEIEDVEVNPIGAVIDEPSAGPDDYLAGMAEFDAKKMWLAYNEQARVQLEGQGNTQDVLAQRLASAKADGARVEGVARIANFPLRDGRHYVFYIVKRSGFQTGAPPEELYYVFTVDPNDKILAIE